MFFFNIGERVDARDHADLSATQVHAIPVPDRIVRVDLKSDELLLRTRLAPDERIAPDEVLALRLQRHRESNAGFERIGLVGELVVEEDEAGLDPEHVERM